MDMYSNKFEQSGRHAVDIVLEESRQIKLAEDFLSFKTRQLMNHEK